MFGQMPNNVAVFKMGSGGVGRGLPTINNTIIFLDEAIALYCIQYCVSCLSHSAQWSDDKLPVVITKPLSQYQNKGGCGL